MSMTNEEILEKQVEALEKLLQLRVAVIEELEAKVAKLSGANNYGTWQGAPFIGGGTLQQGYTGQGQILGGGTSGITWTTPQQGAVAGTIIGVGICTDGAMHSFPSSVLGSPCAKCGCTDPDRVNITSGYISTVGSNNQAGTTSSNVVTLTQASK